MANEFTPGKNFTLAFTVSEADQKAFADLSGDVNPIHLDHAYAKSRGFAAPVVYGGLLVAKLSQIIGMSAPGTAGLWSSLRMDFRNPLLVGESATLEAEISQVSEAARSIILKISVHCGDKLIASGQAMGTLFAESKSHE